MCTAGMCTGRVFAACQHYLGAELYHNTVVSELYKYFNWCYVQYIYIYIYTCHEPVKITVWIEVRNIYMISLINMVQLCGFLSQCIISCLFSIADQWLLYSRMKMTLHNILDMKGGPNTTTTSTQFHAWLAKCTQTRVKRNLVPILQHWNRDRWKTNQTRLFFWNHKVMHYAWFVVIWSHMDVYSDCLCWTCTIECMHIDSYPNYGQS